MKILTSVLLGGVITLSSACASGSNPVLETPTQPEAAIITSVPPSSATPFVTSTTQQTNLIEPELRKLCPQGTDTTLAELGVAPEFRLVVQQFDEYRSVTSGVSTISVSSKAPQLIPGTIPPEGWEYRGFRPILNGEWLESFRQYTGRDETTIWHSSLDGQEEKEVTVLSTGEWSLTSGQDIFVFGDPGDSDDEGRDTIPIKRINLATLESTTLPTLPEGAIFYGSFASDDVWYALYHKGQLYFEDINLFSFLDGTSISVFPWLAGTEGVGLPSTLIGGNNELFTVFVDRPYGFDIAYGLSIEEIQADKTYEQVMRKVILPGEPQYPIYSFLWSFLDLDRLIISRSNGDLTDSIYLLDIEKNILIDYCLTLPTGYSLRTSHDSNHIAVNIPVDIESEFPPHYVKESLVLNLSNGKSTSLGAIRVIGWGSLKDSGSP